MIILGPPPTNRPRHCLCCCGVILQHPFHPAICWISKRTSRIRLICSSGLSIMATYISPLCFFERVQFAFVSWVHSWPLHCRGSCSTSSCRPPTSFEFSTFHGSGGAAALQPTNVGHSSQPMKHAALHPPIRVSSRKKRVPAVTESR
jgi:hypothetical protein